MEIDHENDSHAIPFDEVKKAIEAMQYASAERVMFQMLFLSGCRMSELKSMKLSKLYGNVLYWKLGKCQQSFRKVKLPEYYLQELKEYRNTHRIYGDKFFGICVQSFRRYFNRDIRNKLPSWQKIRFMDKCGELTEEYIFQLKGLRKSYQTLEFAKQLEKWQDAGVALQFTSKKMKHSCERITAYHYIENFDSLNIEKYKHLTPEEILSASCQKRLLDFV